MTTPPVYLEGVGVLTHDGVFVSEDRLRAAVEVINRMCRWFESLPTETQDFIRWECE